MKKCSILYKRFKAVLFGSLPYLTLALKFLLTICVSVASCKRSFFQNETSKKLPPVNHEPVETVRSGCSVNWKRIYKTNRFWQCHWPVCYKEKTKTFYDYVIEGTFFCELPCFPFKCSESKHLLLKTIGYSVLCNVTIFNKNI